KFFKKMSIQRFAVIGAGLFGSAIATALSMRGAEVLVIDSDINLVQDISDDVAYAVSIDATNKKALIGENIQDFDAVIVAIGNDFEARLLCTANLMDLGVKRIICRSMGESQRIILEKMGITEFLSPENEIGTLFAEKLLNPNMITFLQLPDEYRVAEILTPTRLIGMTLGEIDFRENHKLSLITIRRAFTEYDNNKIGTKEHIIGVPENSTVIEEKDVFVLFGKTVDIENFIKINQ
ncbi:TrkA family potassium uptake protein, partial [Bacteroidales bacterium OttesenSCG-928-A14]|nr:TrkA family potassium uptake protein [Bacteroidales bacterium OttesenSCG-928-A14]